VWNGDNREDVSGTKVNCNQPRNVAPVLQRNKSSTYRSTTDRSAGGLVSARGGGAAAFVLAWDDTK